VILGVIISSDERRATLLRMLDELFSTGLREDWVARLRAADIVAAPINTLLEASNDPDVLANGYVAEVDYPKYGKRLKVHGSPWHFSEPRPISASPRNSAPTTTISSPSLVTLRPRSRISGNERSSDIGSVPRPAGRQGYDDAEDRQRGEIL